MEWSRGDGVNGVGVLLDDQSEWPVIVAESVLRSLQRDPCDAVVKKLDCFRRGDWTSSMKRPLTCAQLRVPVYHCRVLNNLWIIWECDIAWNKSMGAHMQVVKVWNVANHDGIKSTLKRLIKLHKAYSEAHIRNCTLNVENRPAIVFGDSHMRAVDRSQEADEGSTESEDSLLLTKFVVLARSVIRCLFDGTDAESALRKKYSGIPVLLQLQDIQSRLDVQLKTLFASGDSTEQLDAMLGTIYELECIQEKVATVVKRLSPQKFQALYPSLELLKSESGAASSILKKAKARLRSVESSFPHSKESTH